MAADQELGRRKGEGNSMSSEQETDRRRAWDYHKAADELLAARVSYGLVAHSMFLVSFATIFAAGKNKVGGW